MVQNEYGNHKTMLFSPLRTGNPLILGMSLRLHSQLRGVDEFLYYNDEEDQQCRDLIAETEVQAAGEGRPFHLLRCPVVDPSSYRSEFHVWDWNKTERLSRIRNAAIQRFLESDCSFLFSVDADVWMRNDLLECLAGGSIGIDGTSLHGIAPYQKDVVCEVFWSRWPDGRGGLTPYLPNVWEQHPYAFASSDHILQLVTPGRYHVGGLGACSLIPRRVLEEGYVNYSPLGNLPPMGEDRYFCTRAIVTNVTLWASVSCTPYHVYWPEQIEEAERWVSDGMNPAYFADNWLDEEWCSQIRGMGQRTDPGIGR